jgi:hypothetical protein
MARMTEGHLERRGRLAYELGRAAWASHVLLLVLPVLLAAHLLQRPAALVLGIGGALTVLAFGLAVLHDRYARAVTAGILSAVPALAIPVLVRSLGIVQLGSAAVDPCIPAAFIAGMLAGAFVSARAVDEKHRISYWLAAILAAALTGVLGCSVVGDVGVLGLMAGLAAGTVPVLVRRGLRRG